MCNRLITLLLINFLSVVVYASNDKKIIESADKLVAKKKYESAFLKLNNYDPENKKIEIFLKKYEIVSKYAVSSKLHRAYSFPNSKKSNQLNYYTLNVDLVFDSLLKLDPNNCELNKLASEHLFDVHNKFGKNWIKAENEYLKQMALYSEKTIQNNCADEQSYYKIGYYLINVGKYKESIYFLYQCVLKNDKNPTYHYNLSLSYLMTKSPASALKHAKSAYENHTDSLFKSDASRLLAEAYFQNKFTDSAIMFYEKAEELDSSTINNIASLLNIYLKTSNAKAETCFEKFYNLDPKNPTIYNYLEQIFTNNNLEEKLIEKYERLLSIHSNNSEILGNLKYYLARLYSINNIELAIKSYQESKTYFEQVHNSDHPIFNSIEKSIEQLIEIKK